MLLRMVEVVSVIIVVELFGWVSVMLLVVINGIMVFCVSLSGWGLI